MKINKKLNCFMEMIYNKVNFKWFNVFKFLSYRRRLKKFHKNILECSPNIDLLWDMADFIKIAELVFFYDNTLKNTGIGLYSSKNFPAGQNGFRINTTECRITIKLFSDIQRVCVEIERLKGEGGKSYLAFTNGDWEDNHTIYDEMLLEQVIKIINNKIMDLFYYCFSIR